MCKKINYTWDIEGLTKDVKNDIKEKIKIKVTEIPYHTIFPVKVTKSPNEGATILITYNNSKTTLEGHYQGHPFSVATILWGPHPPLETP